jgi:hypothetical protein
VHSDIHAPDEYASVQVYEQPFWQVSLRMFVIVSLSSGCVYMQDRLQLAKGDARYNVDNVLEDVVVGFPDRLLALQVFLAAESGSPPHKQDSRVLY